MGSFIVLWVDFPPFDFLCLDSLPHKFTRQDIAIITTTELNGINVAITIYQVIQLVEFYQRYHSNLPNNPNNPNNFPKVALDLLQIFYK